MKLPICFISRSGPSRPTLFPYTTLFRSQAGRNIDDCPALIDKRQAFLGEEKDAFEMNVEDIIQLGFCHCWNGGDRKSTRLNSSHVKNSYAVFCLKKKKNKENQNKRVTRV